MRAAVFVCLLLGWVGVATPRVSDPVDRTESRIATLPLIVTLQRLRGPQADRLAITLYYEALCPYCMEFVTTQLNPSMVRQDRLPFTDLTLVPYGNAMVGFIFRKIKLLIFSSLN